MPELDRVELQVAVMQALQADLAAGEPPEADGVPEARTAMAAVVCVAPGVLAGLPVAREAFGRLGARLRAVAEEGAAVAAGARVAEIGGPLRAILAARPTAFRLLERLSAVASGASRPALTDPLDRYAWTLCPPGGPEAGVDGPRFDLEVLEMQG